MNAYRNQGGIYVWEYPAITPNGDTNSAYSGFRSRNRGIVRACKEVQVTDYAWPEVDNRIASVVTESGCIVATTLPERNIRVIYTGQVIRVESDSGEVSWKGPIWHGGAVIEHDVH